VKQRKSDHDGKLKGQIPHCLFFCDLMLEAFDQDHVWNGEGSKPYEYNLQDGLLHINRFKSLHYCESKETSQDGHHTEKSGDAQRMTFVIQKIESITKMTN